MARYIDADILHIKMEDLYEHHIEMRNFSADGAVADCLDLLDDTPTADVVEVKHGYWEDLYKGKYDNPLYTCSECYCRALYKPETDELGSRVFKQELSKVCPHCFAKMCGGKEE